MVIIIGIFVVLLFDVFWVNIVGGVIKEIMGLFVWWWMFFVGVIFLFVYGIFVI